MDYTTVALVEEELRAEIPFSTSTLPTLATVSNWIAQVSSRINEIGSREYGNDTQTEYFDYEGEDIIILNNTTFVNDSSLIVSYNSSSVGEEPSYTALDLYTDYLVYPKSGEIKLINSTISDGDKRIKIDYEISDTVPGWVEELATKMITERVLSSLINSNVNEGNDGGSISVGSISIVEPESYGVASFTKLKADIKELEKQLVSGVIIMRLGGN